MTDKILNEDISSMTMSFFKNLKTGFHHFETSVIVDIIIFHAGIPLNSHKTMHKLFFCDNPAYWKFQFQFLSDETDSIITLIVIFYIKLVFRKLLNVFPSNFIAAKAHRNGIKRVKKQKYPSLRGVSTLKQHALFLQSLHPQTSTISALVQAYSTTKKLFFLV